MNCHEAGKRFPGLWAHDLDPADFAALQIHLDVCPACREEAAGLIALVEQLDRLPLERPSPAARDRFYRMLDHVESRPPSVRGWRLWAQAAVALLLIGGGFLGGYLTRSVGVDVSPVQDRNLALLRHGETELRMAGIMLVSQGDPEDPVSADALLDRLDKDPSESVRLAAVDALYLYGRQPQVRERLAASLARQTSPRVQMALADLLGGLREQRAVEALKRLLHAPGTTPEVAQRVRAQLKGKPL